MSFAQQNIYAFFTLLKNQQSLFCSEYLFELEKIIAPLADDIEVISLTISKWYFKLPQKRTIHTAQFELLYQLYGEEIGKTRTVADGNIAEVDCQINKKMLLEQIQCTSSSSGINLAQ
jgi:hypothetical protein